MTVAFGVLLALGLGECGARVLVKADPIAQATFRHSRAAANVAKVHQPDWRLGWRNRPGAEAEFVLPESTVHVRIDRLGLRGPEVPQKSGKRRVLLVGDSFVFGWGVEEDQTLGAELARQAPELDVRALGVAGYGTDQELVWLRDQGLKELAPDLVIACFYLNDLVDDASPVRWGRPKTTFRLRADGTLEEVPPPPEPPPAKAPPPPRPRWALRSDQIDDWFVSHMRLYQLLRPRVVTLAVRAGWIDAGEGMDDYLGYFRRKQNPEEERQWRLALAELAEMKRVVEAAGARFAVLEVPAKIQVETGPRRRALAAYGLSAEECDFDQTAARLRDWGRRNGVAVLSVQPALAEAAKTEPQYFRVDAHWNANGHRTAGRALAQLLEKK